MLLASKSWQDLRTHARSHMGPETSLVLQISKLKLTQGDIQDCEYVG